MELHIGELSMVEADEAGELANLQLYCRKEISDNKPDFLTDEVKVLISTKHIGLSLRKETMR